MKRGVDLGLGVGVAQGFATVGAIGFEGRIDYGAIGTVTNLAARLCQQAKAGEILISQRVYAEVSDEFATEDLGELALHGFARPLRAFRVPGACTQRRRRAFLCAGRCGRRVAGRPGAASAVARRLGDHRAQGAPSAEPAARFAKASRAGLSGRAQPRARVHGRATARRPRDAHWLPDVSRRGPTSSSRRADSRSSRCCAPGRRCPSYSAERAIRWKRESSTSYARPGGNMTGISLSSRSRSSGKRLELIREVLPRARRDRARRPTRSIPASARNSTRRRPRRGSWASRCAISRWLAGVELEPRSPTSRSKRRGDPGVRGRLHHGLRVTHRRILVEDADPAIDGWAPFAEAGNLMIYGPGRSPT